MGQNFPSLPGFEEIHTPIMQISSTEVRTRINEGYICEHLVSHMVMSYIEKHNLYS